MKRAIIRNNIVINVIKDHNGINYPFPHDLVVCLDDDQIVGIGYSYENGEFTSPIIEEIENDEEIFDDEIDQWINEE